jgi:hypothetical protein
MKCKLGIQIQLGLFLEDVLPHTTMLTNIDTIKKKKSFVVQFSVFSVLSMKKNQN